MTSTIDYEQKRTKTAPSPAQFLSYYKPGGVGVNEIDVLTELGLSNRQARVYLTILKLHEAKAKTIADHSSVNRQEIYRIIEDLEQIGLVQRNVCVPTTFSATPITEVANVLLAQKTNQLTNLRQKTNLLIKKLQLAHNTTLGNCADKKPRIGTVFEADRAKKYTQTIHATNKTIDITASCKRFKQIINLLEIPLQTALSNGVVIRMVIEKSPAQLLPSRMINKQSQAIPTSLKVKMLFGCPTAAIAIFDQTTAAIAFDPHVNLSKGPDLWTDNPTLVSLCHAYFDNIWAKAE